MKKLLLLGLVLVAFAAHADAQTLANKCESWTEDPDLAANQMACTIAAVSTNHLIVISASSCRDGGFLLCTGTPGDASLADTFGLVWSSPTLTGVWQSSGFGGRTKGYFWWAVTGAHSGSDTFTITYTVTTHMVSMEVGEISTVLTASPLDGAVVSVTSLSTVCPVAPAFCSITIPSVSGPYKLCFISNASVNGYGIVGAAFRTLAAGTGSFAVAFINQATSGGVFPYLAGAGCANTTTIYSNGGGNQASMASHFTATGAGPPLRGHTGIY